MRTLLLIAVVLAASAPGSAEAQEPGAARTGLILGSRLRITTTGDQTPLIGLVVAVDPQTVTLATDAGAVKTPVSSISVVEISLGKRRYTRRGMAIGAALGLVAGLLGDVDEKGVSPALGDESRGALVGYSIFSGTAFGAIVGALIKTDRWSPVDVSIAPTPGPAGRPGIRLVGTIRF